MFAVLDRAGAVLAEAPHLEDALRLARTRHPAAYDRVVGPDGTVYARALRGDLRRMPSLAATRSP